MYRVLQNSTFFRDIDLEDIKSILDSTHFNTSDYRKNDIIYCSGDTVDSLIIIIKGQVRTEMLDASGKTFRMEDIQIGHVIGPGFLYGDKGNFPVNVVANCDTTIMIIPKKSFEYLLSKYPKLMVNYLNIISNKTQYLAQKIKNVFLQPIEGKIAFYLIKKMKETNSTEFEMDKSQRWFAERFNVARPSIARVFALLKTRGIIETNGKTIKVINTKKLAKCIN